MKAAIFGIGPDNYNFRKLEGIARGFDDLGYESVSMHSPLSLLDNSVTADVAFIESMIPEYANLARFQKVVVWQNWSPSRIVELSKKYKNVEFVLGSKSIIHVPEFRERYRKKFRTSEYQRCDETRELIDLDDCENLNSSSQLLCERVKYAYAPCSVASDSRYTVEKDLDVVYFGTGANRPGVIDILNSLPPTLKIAAHFVESSGPIHPEVCVSLYRRAKVCLHEQVSPVWGEFAVRFGEATAQGCRIISLCKDFSISDIVDDSLIPEHTAVANTDEAIFEIKNWLEPREIDRERMRKSSPRNVDLLRRILE